MKTYEEAVALYCSVLNDYGHGLKIVFDAWEVGRVMGVSEDAQTTAKSIKSTAVLALTERGFANPEVHVEMDDDYCDVVIEVAATEETNTLA